MCPLEKGTSGINEAVTPLWVNAPILPASLKQHGLNIGNSAVSKNR